MEVDWLEEVTIVLRYHETRMQLEAYFMSGCAVNMRDGKGKHSDVVFEPPSDNKSKGVLKSLDLK